MLAFSRFWRVATTATLMILTAGAFAAAPPLDETDSMFLQKAAQANAAEIKVSQAAQTRAKNPAVRAFADRMVKDHSDVGHELEALAKRKNVEIKTEPDPDHMVKIGSLQKLEGAEFDRGYSALMVSDHAAAVALFEKAAAETGGDADVKQFAEQALPTLREHAEQARSLPH